MQRMGLLAVALASALLPAASAFGLAVAVAPASTAPPHGVALVIHGGAWQASGPEAMASAHAAVSLAKRAGWAAINLDHRPGAAAVSDVVAAYDQARRRSGDRAAICAIGQSSGGHLALMLAALRPGLACVVAVGAPTDLTTAQATAPFLFELGVRRSFPLDQLADYSPVALAERIRARVLLAAVVTDPIVPITQMLAYLAADPDAVGMLLPPGNAPFLHTSASAEAVRRFDAAAIALLHAIGGSQR